MAGPPTFRRVMMRATRTGARGGGSTGRTCALLYYRRIGGQGRQAGHERGRAVSGGHLGSTALVTLHGQVAILTGGLCRLGSQYPATLARAGRAAPLLDVPT